MRRQSVAVLTRYTYSIDGAKAPHFAYSPTSFCPEAAWAGRARRVDLCRILDKGIEVNTLAVLTRYTYSKDGAKAPPRASRTRRRGTALNKTELVAVEESAVGQAYVRDHGEG